MSLLDQTNQLYEIKVYYKYITVGGNKKLVILEDDKAEEMMKDENKKKDISVLITKWSNPTWREQNEVSQVSTIVSATTGQRDFSFIKYRDAIVKRCLKEWNISVNDRNVPITSEAIDSLPGEIVTRLYQKFEKILDYTEEELGN